MSYPSTHKLATVHSWAYIQDISSSSAQDNSAVKSAEFYGQLKQVRFTLNNAITTANATITIAKNGTSIGTQTITQSGSAAGSQFTFVPNSATRPLVFLSDGISH